MLTRETQVINLVNGSEQTFFNASPAVENLITAHMIDIGMSSQIHNSITREKHRSKVQRGKVSMSLGDLCVMKDGRGK